MTKIRLWAPAKMDVLKGTVINNTVETHWIGNGSWLAMRRVKPQTVSLLCWTLWMGLVTVMVSLGSERSWSYSASQSSRSSDGVFRLWPIAVCDRPKIICDCETTPVSVLKIHHDYMTFVAYSYMVSPTIPHKYTVLNPLCHGATVHFFANENPLDLRTKQATMMS